jgi:hypothetical protein
MIHDVFRDVRAIGSEFQHLKAKYRYVGIKIPLEGR